MTISLPGRRIGAKIATTFVLAATFGTAMLAVPTAASAQIVISVGFAPPALPVYVQPVIPGDGYLWNPGYWAYAPAGYYWVPGVWVQPPSVGLLWTPPYWGFAGGVYGFHSGYWGPHVGFYGGVNYGFGFGGVGFVGGRWDGGHFAYNSAVMNVGGGFHGNVYVDRTVIVNNNNSHTSFNGGPGGLQARPSAQEAAYAHENHVAPTAAQQSHFQSAQSNKANFATANGGHPAMAAVSRPGATTGAVAARGAEPARPGAEAARPGAAQPHAAGAPAAHPAAAPANRPAAAPAARSAPAQAARPAAQPHAQPAQHAQSHPAPAAHAASQPKGGEKPRR
jgi:hypothetical protein